MLQPVLLYKGSISNLISSLVHSKVLTFTFPIKFLSQYFDVTVFYNNSNIFPESEYQRRKDELKKFLEYNL